MFNKLTLIGQPWNSWHCKTSNDRNFWFSNGTLAIAAVKEKYLDKEFTSGLMRTKMSFSSPLIEVRAALPKGRWLRPTIYTIPATMASTGQWHQWPDEIGIMINKQEQTIYNVIHYMGDDFIARVNDSKVLINSSLNEFHTYSVQWSETYIQWMFDGIQTWALNLTEVLAPLRPYNPFTKPVWLSITLGVGGGFFGDPPDPEDLEDDVQNWNCSLLIIDYVRVYRWVEKGSNISEISGNFEPQNDIDSSQGICKEIMPKIKSERKPRKLKLTSTHLILIANVILVIFIFAFILYFRFRKSGKKPENDYNIYDTYDTYDCYYDSGKGEEVYEECNQESNDNYYVDTVSPFVECSENEQGYISIPKRDEVKMENHPYLQIL